ncbi:uncharacterized protein LOC110233459 [Exaiptasia diaphana]|uniref:RRM domain-containing protein n=1 Tax=Exaiptasia diaphana TaxID=2652724 RepID=A0A913WUP6_EXADI|nr:uncharacterized protein LOC110233459 [Exaiptasia diaphana]
MATFGWSYKSNISGVKRPKEIHRKIEDWQKDREDVKIPLHRQTHSSESVNAGMKRRRYNPKAKIFIGSLNKDTKPITLAEYFSFFGEISYMKIIKDKETKVSRGFAFITFVEVEDAEKAVRWCRGNHPRVDGKEIRVGFAERRFGPVDKRPSELIGGIKVPSERRDTHTLYWEYKWTLGPESEVYGPYETGLMLQWCKMGYFTSGCWVRQVHHVNSGQEKKTQGSECSDKSEKIFSSLVDSYSSSSEDEETPKKRTKTDSTRENPTNLTENDETSGNNERKDEDSISNDNKLEQKSELQKEEKETESVLEFDKDKNLSKDKDVESDVSTEEVLHSYYQKDEDGYKTSDIFGRDSSSEDEDYDFSDEQFMENDFVHINDIDFSIFP